MAGAELHELRVVAVEPRTPNLKRIILEGESLADFPCGYEGGYVKLLLPRDDAGMATFDLRTAIKRSYTVRAFDRDARHLTLEFAGHETQGPATRWANGARTGDTVRIAGPGPVKGLDPSADWFLLAGDMTALPAIAVLLEGLPRDACGHALIEVPSAADIQLLRHPTKVQVHWLVQPSWEEATAPLARKIEALPWPAGQVGVWVACEFSTMKAVRRHLVEVRGVTKAQMYISSYWKRGAADEEHKVFKAADAKRAETGLARTDSRPAE